MIERPTQEIIDAIEDGTVVIKRRCEFYQKDGETRWHPEGPTLGEGIPRLLPDGNINIDPSRDERRTFDIMLDNSDGLLRPHNNGFWYDKIIKMYRGLVVGDIEKWWPLGTFCIDNFDDKNFPKTLHVVGRDYTKKMLLSKLTNSESYAAGTKLGDLVKALATNSGIPVSRLARIPIDTPTLGTVLDVERGTDRWSIARDAALAKNYELFFDAEGYLRLQLFADPLLSAIEWTFLTGSKGNLVSYERSINDSELYNVVQVQGAAPEEGGLAPFWEARNTEPSSPTSVDKIGERVMPLVQLDTATTVAECKTVAESLLKVAGLESYELSYETILYPWFEGNSVVEVLEQDRIAGDPTRFLLGAIDMPIQLGPMSCTANRITVVGDVRDIPTTTPDDATNPNPGTPSTPPDTPPDIPVDETPDEPPVTPANPGEPTTVGTTTEILRIASFNVWNGYNTRLELPALEKVANHCDMFGIQEGYDLTPAMNQFLNRNREWSVWKGTGRPQQACMIFYRKALGTVTGKKMTLAHRGGYYGPKGNPVRGGDKYVAELEIKLAKTGRTITQFNIHTIAGIGSTKAAMGNPEWQRRQDKYKQHIDTLCARIDACNTLIFGTGDYNTDPSNSHVAKLFDRVHMDHDFKTHNGKHKMDYVYHKLHNAISVVDAELLVMGAVSDHDSPVVTYKITSA